ncbi:hypothetical protein NBRC111894_80 [Sporolactobacillus inulinus]|uniref:Uncharacterized protein n=1 Tax=Sporolactobacillus inulinus TaxID=2078 RepID=A0A4Y1Z6H5_9BACL|nr:hypothetical protein NBRC111894_80 [Sporolactobacillus inulinus]
MIARSVRIHKFLLTVIPVNAMGSRGETAVLLRFYTKFNKI